MTSERKKKQKTIETVCVVGNAQIKTHTHVDLFFFLFFFFLNLNFSELCRDSNSIKNYHDRWLNCFETPISTMAVWLKNTISIG